MNNPATVYELSLVDGEFTQTSKISARGDYEGMTMRSDDLSKVYVLGEGCECIIEYDMSSKKKLGLGHYLLFLQGVEMDQRE